MVNSDTIGERSKRCFDLLEQSAKAVWHLEKGDNDHINRSLSDEFSRFRLWISNIGVFADVQLSLDFRVREVADLRDLFLRHLGTVERRLVQLDEMSLKNQLEEDALTARDQAVMETDVESPRSATPELKPNPFEEWDSAGLIESIHKSISWLHRLSNSVRKASFINQDKRAKDFELEDYEGKAKAPVKEEVVRMIYRRILQESNNGLEVEMRERLVDTMVIRLKRILYRRNRQAKWSLPQITLSTATQVYLPDPSLQKPPSIATVPIIQPVVVTFSPPVEDGLRPPLGLKPATTLDVRSWKDKYTKSEMSRATSTSRSLQGKLLFPVPPKDASESESFTCPYCCLILSSSIAQDRKAWENHVKKDLNPYVCVYFPCNVPDEIYPTSVQWLAHMKAVHRMRWQCHATDHEPRQYDTSEEFKLHMQKAHEGTFPVERLPFISEISCQPISPTVECCPFCSDFDETHDKLEAHVGRHLQAIALHSLHAPGSISSGQGESISVLDDPQAGNSDAETRTTMREFEALKSSTVDFPVSDEIQSPPGARLEIYGDVRGIKAQHEEITPSVLSQDGYETLLDFARIYYGCESKESLFQLLLTLDTMSATSHTVSATGIEVGKVDYSASLTTESKILTEVHIRDEGFTVLSEGVEKPVADVIFIHGMLGHPDKTWRYSESEIESVKRKRRLANLFFRKKQPEDMESSRTSPIFWPKDLLAKDFPNTRVLTYGYDSQLSKFFNSSGNQGGILVHSKRLMHALDVQRRGCRQRPIIFLAHSLGGVILKQALVHSKNAIEKDQDLHDIYQSTYAIIFFGTPHRGSSYAQMGDLARDITVATGLDVRDTFIRSLQPDSEMLLMLREEFSLMLQERPFKIHSFQEGQVLKVTHNLSRKIVNDDSSRLDDPREQIYYISANHITMCQFQDENDEGYNKVKGVVSNCIDEIQTQVANEQNRHKQEQILLAEMAAKEKAMLDLKRKALVKDVCNSLRIAHMNERVREIRTAHTYTFDWVFTNPEAGFLDWLHGSESLFWITGKPGSGKSTLMKYLLEDSRTREALSQHGRPVLSTPSYFFHARGVESEKSFDGLLRSIVYQLLLDVPELVSSVADIYQEYLNEDQACPWTIPQLEAALDSIRRQQLEGCICIFIDALDEYSGRSEDIARFINRLAAPVGISQNQTLTIRVCATSRPWNTFTSLLGKFPGFTIQDWTRDDIRKFAADRLQGCNRDNTSIIVEEITYRAEGVFLWVTLVLDELWQPLCDGNPIEDVRYLLSGFPTDLSELYKRMTENIPPEDRATLMGMIELVLCSEYASSGIKFPVFCLAIDLLQGSSLLTKEFSLEPAADSRRQREVERRIIACSSGLLEVVQSDLGSSVQFVHRTVKLFIGDPGNISFLNGKSIRDIAAAGVCYMMRIMILLTGHMDSTREWPGLHKHISYAFVEPTCPKQFPHFDSDVVTGFISWALIYELEFQSASPTLIHDFHKAICHNCGINWLDTWWSTVPPQLSTLNSQNPWVFGSLKPSSLVEFTVQLQLFLFSSSEISSEILRNPEVPRNPKLLYYVLIGITRPFPHIREAHLKFARFLLAESFDPNELLEVTIGPDYNKLMNDFYNYDNETEEEINSLDSKYLVSGASETQIEITVIHLALAIVCSTTIVDEWVIINLLGFVTVLIEGGGDANVSNYRNYWSHQEGGATGRSAIHYLLSTRYNCHRPFHHPNYEVNEALSQCITTFLRYGADPNGIDTNGVSILELALPVCPYALVEHMLQNGARVVPQLLSESGEPSNDADGILREMRWRRAECYTEEARVIARKYNSHWRDFENGQ